MTQRFQTFSATLRERAAGEKTGATAAAGAAPTAVFDGRVNATQMFAAAAVGAAQFQLQVLPSALELSQASGAAARFQGQRFVAAGSAGCP